MDSLIDNALDREDLTELGSVERMRHALITTMIQSVGRDPTYANAREWFDALAHLVRSVLIARYVRTARAYHRAGVKRVYYLSVEYLPGPSMAKHLADLDVEEEVRQVLAEFGINLDQVVAEEREPALGNGGLGRLASCFLDSMAAHGYPGFGYGIRYDFGLFSQSIEDGAQVEHAESWLRDGSPWEFVRPHLDYPVRFGGRVERDHGGPAQRSRWTGGELVSAIAYDVSIAGFQVPTVNNLRLWSARATEDFDLGQFNRGDYIEAVKAKTAQETLSKVLYPSDTTYFGQELRLKQQYFFVSASLQDILARFRRESLPLERLGDRVAVQLNDTHPALAVAELMRLLVDEHGLDWATAWRTTTEVISYTNHTLLPEALETWPIAMLRQMLPRHLEIIFEINHHFLEEVRLRFPGDLAIVQRLSLVDDAGQRIRMAHLAVVASHRVNGVAALHTQLLRERLFADFDHLWPEKFVNVTNGITQRRWLRLANPGLSRLVSARLGGEGWTRDLPQLAALAPLAGDQVFQDRILQVKQRNKQRLAIEVAERVGIAIDPQSLFDVQVKRIHEYKRQLLNLLHVIMRYEACRQGRPPRQPRTIIFAGKAAPSYVMAKTIIRLINDVARVVNQDQATRDHLRVVFLPNYSVSLAERIIPAADLSEQISTAGTEASGTGNMKFALNGALTIGTLDGANIEIRDAVGAENIFIFGLDAARAQSLRAEGYRPRQYLMQDERLRVAIEMIAGGHFSPGERQRYGDLVHGLVDGGDRYLLCADFASYVETQAEVDRVFLDRREWTRRAILNIARMGPFSSDRSIATYAQRIWNVSPLAL